MKHRAWGNHLWQVLLCFCLNKKIVRDEILINQCESSYVRREGSEAVLQFGLRIIRGSNHEQLLHHVLGDFFRDFGRWGKPSDVGKSYHLMWYLLAWDMVQPHCPAVWLHWAAFTARNRQSIENGAMTQWFIFSKCKLREFSPDESKWY